MLWTGATGPNTSFTEHIYRTFGPQIAAQKPFLIVQLPSDIDDPLHAVETSSGHFLVLHSLEKDADETTKLKVNKKELLFAVSKVTRDVRLVVRRFVSQNKTQELNDPNYLALDSGDRVFVADKGSHRVILLDSDLNWSRILSPTECEDEGTRMPHRLRYDKVERQLIVAGCFRHKVNVNIIGGK